MQCTHSAFLCCSLPRTAATAEGQDLSRLAETTSCLLLRLETGVHWVPACLHGCLPACLPAAAQRQLSTSLAPAHLPASLPPRSPCRL